LVQLQKTPWRWKLKAGKKIHKKEKERTERHLEGLAARRRKGMSEPEKGYKFPGSKNKKKLALT
jgi:hypothetical protein